MQEHPDDIACLSSMYFGLSQRNGGSRVTFFFFCYRNFAREATTGGNRALCPVFGSSRYQEDGRQWQHASKAFVWYHTHTYVQADKTDRQRERKEKVARSFLSGQYPPRAKF